MCASFHPLGSHQILCCREGFFHLHSLLFYRKKLLFQGKQRELKGTFIVRDAPCGPGIILFFFLTLPMMNMITAAAGSTGKKYNSAFQVQTPKRTYFMITESLEDLVLWQRVRDASKIRRQEAHCHRLSYYMEDIGMQRLQTQGIQS